MAESQSPIEIAPDCPDEAIRLVCVMNEQGLHARPAAKLAQAAQQFEAAISISMGPQVVDAKSILDILTLAAGHGANLELRARGSDACDALEALADMFKNRFQ
ncbi:MAG: HPr family phosphocarrier protein [Thermodesulfobacteriota bacterium]